jgi:hypothetical protein
VEELGFLLLQLLIELFFQFFLEVLWEFGAAEYKGTYERGTTTSSFQLSGISLPERLWAPFRCYSGPSDSSSPARFLA